MAVEPLSITASIGSTLKFLGSAYLYAKNVANASDQAQQVADQLLATKALLKSLKHTLKAVQRPRHFVQQWEPTARSIMTAIQSTMKQLNEKLGNDSKRSSGVKLGFWGKMTWPLEREETLALQSQLYGSMQMLSMLQSALMMRVATVFQPRRFLRTDNDRGTVEAIQQSNGVAEETMTSIDFSCFSMTTISMVPSTNSEAFQYDVGNDKDTISADDSVSVRPPRPRSSLLWKASRDRSNEKTRQKKASCFFDTVLISLSFSRVDTLRGHDWTGSYLSGNCLHIGVVEVDLLLIGNSDLVFFKLKDAREIVLATYTYDLKVDSWPEIIYGSTESLERLVVHNSLAGRYKNTYTIFMGSTVVPGEPTKTPLAESLTKLWKIWKPWHDAGSQTPFSRPTGN